MYKHDWLIYIKKRKYVLRTDKQNKLRNTEKCVEVIMIDL